MMTELSFCLITVYLKFKNVYIAPPEDYFTMSSQVHEYMQTKRNIICCACDSKILIIPFHETLNFFSHLSWCWNIHDSHRKMLRYWQATRVWAKLRVPLCICVCIFVCVFPFCVYFLLPIMPILMVPKHACTYLINKLVFIIKRVCVSPRYTCRSTVKEIWPCSSSPPGPIIASPLLLFQRALRWALVAADYSPFLSFPLGWLAGWLAG